MAIANHKTPITAKPFLLRLASDSSIGFAVRTLLGDAIQRRRFDQNGSYLTLVMTHLVEAWLMLFKERKGVGFQALYRTPLAFDGDFRIGKTIIHVTNSPEPDLICRCLMNRKHGFRPLIITTAPGARQAEELADEVGNRKAIEVLDITQFLVANMLEWTGFDGTQRRHSFEDLVTHYNQIVEACETDPSLRIEIA